MDKGYFITLEGPEGSGKSTQAGLLVDELSKLGYRVVFSREPGGTAMGEAIREILLNKANRITPMAELLLYAAARAQNMVDTIVPALQEGKVVICDRFMDSSVAYQGFARGLGADLVARVNDMVLNGIKPNLTILLDIDPEIGLGRVKSGGLDRLEQEDISFHRKVRQGYLQLSEQEDRFVVFDGRDKKASLHRKILQKVLYLITQG